jgi:hypothetical protein
MEGLDTTFMRLAETLAQRANLEFQCGTAPEAVVAELVQAGVAPAKAELLAWGLGAELTASELDSLSAHFVFHPGLLATVLNPPSRDLLELTLEQVMDELNYEECDYCETLYDRCMVHRHDGDIDEPLAELLFDLLAHIRATEPQPLSAEEWTSETGADADDELDGADWTAELAEHRARLAAVRELLSPEAAEALDLLEQLPAEAHLKALGYLLDLVELERWES